MDCGDQQKHHGLGEDWCSQQDARDLDEYQGYLCGGHTEIGTPWELTYPLLKAF